MMASDAAGRVLCVGSAMHGKATVAYCVTRIQQQARAHKKAKRLSHRALSM